MQKIALATDFTDEGDGAFHSALALAVTFRAQLEILHVGDPDERTDWARFPHVRDVLVRWGLLPFGAAQEDVYDRLGVKVDKVMIHSSDAASGISSFIAKRSADLLVAASHGRSGLSSFMEGSVALETLERTSLPTLLLGPKAASLADAATGRLRLERALLPVDLSPSPTHVLHTSRSLLGAKCPAIYAVHVDEDAARTEKVRALVPGVKVIRGEVIPSLLSAARQTAADLIIMPTEGRKGFMDAIRGSTTQRMLREAECPILALPAQ